MIGSLFGYPIVNLSDKFKTELRKKYRKLHDFSLLIFMITLRKLRS